LLQSGIVELCGEQHDVGVGSLLADLAKVLAAGLGVAQTVDDDDVRLGLADRGADAVAGVRDAEQVDP
jgi:hypothetical protein